MVSACGGGTEGKDDVEQRRGSNAAASESDTSGKREATASDVAGADDTLAGTASNAGTQPSVDSGEAPSQAVGGVGTDGAELNDFPISECEVMCAVLARCMEGGGDCIRGCDEASLMADAAGCDAQWQDLKACFASVDDCGGVRVCEQVAGALFECVEPRDASGDLPPESVSSDVDMASVPSCEDVVVDDYVCTNASYSVSRSNCEVSCDGDETRWSSFCAEGLCRCQRDGVAYCECTQNDEDPEICGSCCPGLADSALGL